MGAMPASKKDLRANKQKKNVAAGIGDEKGRMGSNNKEPQVMVACTICKQQIRMVKKNEQAKVHVESKHSGKAFDVCFPGYTWPPLKIQYSVNDSHGSSHDVMWPGTPSHPPNPEAVMSRHIMLCD